MNDTDIPLPPHGKPPVSNDRVLSCRWCNSPAGYDTLNAFGARCFPCYARFLRAPQPAPLHVADKRGGGRLAWARALKAREESDPQALTQAQREMWRDALSRDLARESAAENEVPEVEA